VEEWQILVSIGSCFYCWFDVFGGDHNPFCCDVEGSWQVIAVYVCKRYHANPPVVLLSGYAETPG
jgi:hypothetical protein